MSVVPWLAGLLVGIVIAFAAPPPWGRPASALAFGLLTAAALAGRSRFAMPVVVVAFALAWAATAQERLADPTGDFLRAAGPFAVATLIGLPLAAIAYARSSTPVAAPPPVDVPPPPPALVDEGKVATLERELEFARAEIRSLREEKLDSVVPPPGPKRKRP